MQYVYGRSETILSVVMINQKRYNLDRMKVTIAKYNDKISYIFNSWVRDIMRVVNIIYKAFTMRIQ